MKLSDGHIKNKLPGGLNIYRHEAAHAVITEYFGIKVTEISIFDRSFGYIELRDFDHCYTEDNICISLAPNVFLGHINGSGGDIQSIRKLVRTECMDDAEGIKTVQNCQTKVRKILENQMYIDQIEELAKQLKIYRTLTDIDVHEILDCVTSGKPIELDPLGVYVRNVKFRIIKIDQLVKSGDNDSAKDSLKMLYHRVPRKFLSKVKSIANISEVRQSEIIYLT